MSNTNTTAAERKLFKEQSELARLGMLGWPLLVLFVLAALGGCALAVYAMQLAQDGVGLMATVGM